MLLVIEKYFLQVVQFFTRMRWLRSKGLTILMESIGNKAVTKARLQQKEVFQIAGVCSFSYKSILRSVRIYDGELSSGHVQLQ
jgi:hypothetical protein